MIRRKANGDRLSAGRGRAAGRRQPASDKNDAVHADGLWTALSGDGVGESRVVEAGGGSVGRVIRGREEIRGGVSGHEGMAGAHRSWQGTTAPPLVADVLPAYGLEGSRVRLLEVATNVVFRIDAPDGSVFVLKVDVEEDYSDAHMDIALDWLAAINVDTSILSCSW